jgi:hypothetical protein
MATVHLLVPVGDEDKEGQGGERAGEEAEQIEGGSREAESAQCRSSNRSSIGWLAVTATRKV